MLKGRGRSHANHLVAIPRMGYAGICDGLILRFAMFG